MPKIASLGRAVTMLEAIIADGGRNNVSQIAGRTGMPVATAHRQVATLAAEGFLSPAGKGRYVAGLRLRNIARQLDEGQIVASVARPALDRLAARLGTVVQLGTLENDMVTYRIKAGRSAAAVLSRVGMQLEAYCSGIGKVLLAHLPDAAREEYLANGPFVALTANTIVDPELLRQELETVRRNGFAIDNGEIAEDLRCIAMPLRRPDGEVIAAISVSHITGGRKPRRDDEVLSLLKEAVDAVESAAFA